MASLGDNELRLLPHFPVANKLIKTRPSQCRLQEPCFQQTIRLNGISSDPHHKGKHIEAWWKWWLFCRHFQIHFFSYGQAALWMVQSVCLSVCLSHLFDYVPIIMKFSGVITNDRCDVHAKGQGQRSKVKFTKVSTQLSRFWTVTPVWIHIWRWNHAQSLMLLRRGVLLFFRVIRQISRSHG